MPDFNRIINEQMKAQTERLQLLRTMMSREAVVAHYVDTQVEQARLQAELNKKVTDALRTKSEKILKATAAIAGLTGQGGIAGFGGAIGGIFGGVTGAAAGAAVGGAAGGAVGKFSPGTMERLSYAFDDLTAVLGERLMPIFETVVVPVVRLFGDVLESILPSGQEFAEILKPVTDFLADLRDALASIAPVIHDVLVVGLKALGIALQVVLIPFQALAEL